MRSGKLDERCIKWGVYRFVEVCYSILYEQIPVAVDDDLYLEFEEYINRENTFGKYSTSIIRGEDLQKCFTPLDRVETPNVHGRLDFDLEVPSDSIITLKRERQNFIDQLR